MKGSLRAVEPPAGDLGRGVPEATDLGRVGSALRHSSPRLLGQGSEGDVRVHSAALEVKGEGTSQGHQPERASEADRVPGFPGRHPARGRPRRASGSLAEASVGSPPCAPHRPGFLALRVDGDRAPAGGPPAGRRAHGAGSARGGQDPGSWGRGLRGGVGASRAGGREPGEGRDRAARAALGPLGQ